MNPAILYLCLNQKRLSPHSILSQPARSNRLRTTSEVLLFHLMSWPYLPADFEDHNDSAWIWCPNKLFDPALGSGLYRDYIDTLAYADELGFDGVCVNEHHQNAYGLMPSPNLVAAALTQRTKRVKSPSSAMLCRSTIRPSGSPKSLPCSTMSEGRLIAGFVVGGGPEYFSWHQSDLRSRALCRGTRSDHSGLDRAWSIYL